MQLSKNYLTLTMTTTPNLALAQVMILRIVLTKAWQSCTQPLYVSGTWRARDRLFLKLVISYTTISSINQKQHFTSITRVNKATSLQSTNCSKTVIFHNKSRNTQAPLHWQVACTLDRLGKDGQGVSMAEVSSFGV